MAGIEYIKNLVLCLASLPAQTRSGFEVCLICGEDCRQAAAELSAALGSTYFYDASPALLTPTNIMRLGMNKILLGQPDLRLHRVLKTAKVDFAYPYAATFRWKQPFRSAAWIPDCQHKHLSQFFTQQEVQARDKGFATIASHSSVIVFSSKSAEADFREFFKGRYRSEILSPRMRPVPAWYEIDPVETQRAYHLPDRFFMISNQFWQHKNHLLVFNALKLLSEKGVHPVVVCTGGLHDYRSPSFSSTVLQTIHRLGIANQVYLLGVIPRVDMMSLMRRALAVVQPSLFEGWNLGVEEARCLGKPIVLSDIPVHREQDPPGSVFFAVDSAEQLATILGQCWSELSPGPDADREEAARNSSLGEAKAFACRFLDIARGE